MWLGNFSLIEGLRNSPGPSPAAVSEQGPLNRSPSHAPRAHLWRTAQCYGAQRATATLISQPGRLGIRRKRISSQARPMAVRPHLSPGNCSRAGSPQKTRLHALRRYVSRRPASDSRLVPHSFKDQSEIKRAREGIYRNLTRPMHAVARACQCLSNLHQPRRLPYPHASARGCIYRAQREASTLL